MMESRYIVKNPPKRKIPKGRVSRQHHYTMIFPKDLIGKNWTSTTKPKNVLILKGKAYIGLFDSFLEDCVKRMLNSPYSDKFYDEGGFEIMTACLN